MKKKLLADYARTLAAALTLTVGIAGAGFAQEVPADAPAKDAPAEKQDLPKIGGTIQMLGAIEYLQIKDNSPTERQDARMYLFLKQARLNVSGKIDGIDYYVQAQFGGEEVPGTNSIYSLLDAYVDAPILSKTLGVRFGQFKVPFSREMLTDPNSLQFGDTSINTSVFNIQRDVGFAFHGEMSNIHWAAGTFTGGGTNIPQRYIPQSLGIPQLVLRVGYDTLDKDLFKPKQSDPNRKGTGLAAYVSASYQENSAIGHGQVFSSKKNDTSWFQNTAWNPYLSQSGVTNINASTITQYEADVAYQTEISAFKIFAAAEANWGRFDSNTGSLTLMGGAVQAAATYKIFEIALRYAVIIPDQQAGYQATATGTGLGPAGFYKIFTNNSPIHEINPALNFYLTKNLTLKMDLDIWYNTPVMQEAASGAYNLMTMAQTSYAQKTSPAPSVVERQNAVTARMVAQMIF